MSSVRSELTQAIAVHKMWADTLCTAIRCGRIGGIKIEKIRQDDQCELGRWLEQDYVRLGFENLSALDEVIQLHQNFHQCAARVLEFVHEGDIESANEIMKESGEFRMCSSALIDALTLIGESGPCGNDRHLDADATNKTVQTGPDIAALCNEAITNDVLQTSRNFAKLISSKFSASDFDLLDEFLNKSNPGTVIEELKQLILQFEQIT